MIPVESIFVLPFLLVGVFWLLIDDDEFDAMFQDWVQKNSESEEDSDEQS